VIIDNGASSFVPLSHYLISNQVPALLQDMGHELVVHTVITGGQALLDTVSGFAQLASQFPAECLFVVWLNPYLGANRARRQGLRADEGLHGQQGAGVGHRPDPGAQGRNLRPRLSEMLQERLTFDEALAMDSAHDHDAAAAQDRERAALQPAGQRGGAVMADQDRRADQGNRGQARHRRQPRRPDPDPANDQHPADAGQRQGPAGNAGSPSSRNWKPSRTAGVMTPRDKAERTLNAALAASKEAMAKGMQEGAKAAAEAVRREVEAVTAQLVAPIREARRVAMMNMVAAGMAVVAAGLALWASL
jgi:hypothetical protein